MTGRPSTDAFRRHLALTAAGVTAGFTLAAAALLFVPLFAHLDGDELPPDALGGIATYVLHLHESFWPVVLGALVASIASGMLLFERMRQPLVRFVRVYEQVARGAHPEPLVLRMRDYLQDEAAALNAMVAALETKDARTRGEVERIRNALAELPDEELEPKLAAALNEVRDASDALARALDTRA